MKRKDGNFNKERNKEKDSNKRGSIKRKPRGGFSREEEGEKFRMRGTKEEEKEEKGGKKKKTTENSIK